MHTETTAELRHVLDGRWADVRDDVRAQMGPYRLTPDPDPDLTIEQHRERVLAGMRLLADSGRPHRGFAPEYGGAGDVGGVVTAFGMLGYGDLSLLVKAGVQWGLFGGAVQLLGTRRHHERYLRDIMGGTLLGCFAMTETGHGSDVQHLCTTATYDAAAQEFVIHTPDPSARKDYIGNAARDGRLAVVFAQLLTLGHGHGVHAFLVPIRTEDGPAPGVHIEDCGRKAGLNGVDNGRLSFDHVRVPRAALLNRFADVAEDGTYASPIENETRRFFTMLGTLVRGRISVAGGAGSATQKALTLAVRYGEQRRQFANPATGEEVVVLDYLAHQRKLLPALATTYALHFAQEELVAAMHEVQTTAEPDDAPDEAAQRDLETRAAGVKAVGTWHASATIQTCREACGGAGYLEENLLPALKADTDVFTTFEGDNTVLLQLVAKGLLSAYGARFAELGPLGQVGFVAGQVAGVVVEKTGAWALLNRGDWRDGAYQRALLAGRAEHLLAGVARRLRPALKPGADQFAIFNAAQAHLLAAARAHVDVVIFDAFVAAVERSGGVSDLLGRVCDLHALHRIEADRAWYVEHGFLTARRSRELPPTVDALCTELRPHARLLVDGFGIPEGWLACPLLGGTPTGTDMAAPADLAAAS